jgi:hypothetical protein
LGIIVSQPLDYSASTAWGLAILAIVAWVSRDYRRHFHCGQAWQLLGQKLQIWAKSTAAATDATDQNGYKPFHICADPQSIMSKFGIADNFLTMGGQKDS